MDLPQMIRVSYRSLGEERRKLIQQMDLKTHPGNGSINQLPFLKSIITIDTEILGMRELPKKFMDLLLLTRVSYLNHGEEQRSHIQSMVLKTQNGNGWINRDHYLKNIITTIISTEILE